MKGLLFNNWPHKIAAVAIALLLWQIVSLTGQNRDRKSYENISIDVKNKPKDLDITAGKTTIRVEATSIDNNVTLDDIDGEKIAAYVDLNNAEPGDHTFSVKLNYPASYNGFARLIPDPETVRLTLERIIERTVRVDVHFASEQFPAKWNLNPKSVRIRGVESIVTQAVSARITVTAKVNPGETYDWPVEIFDENERKLDLTIDPPRVKFSVQQIPILTERNVLIQARLQGSVPFGYQVDRYQVTPDYISVKGNPQTLATLTIVGTEPIDISDLKENRTFSVRPTLPQGTESDVQLVSVTVYVSKTRVNE